MAESKPVTAVEFIEYLKTLPPETRIECLNYKEDSSWSGCGCSASHDNINLAPAESAGWDKHSTISCYFGEYKGPYLEIGVSE